MDRINLADKLALVDDHWNPRVIAELNGQHVKLVKLLGSFTWHHHEHEHERFLVVTGSLNLEFRGRSVVIGPGELSVVPPAAPQRRGDAVGTTRGPRGVYDERCPGC